MSPWNGLKEEALINPEQDLKRQGGGAENPSGGKQIDLYRMFLTIHILKMDIDLDFLLELKRGELERLAACIRDRADQVGG